MLLIVAFCTGGITIFAIMNIVRNILHKRYMKAFATTATLAILYVCGYYMLFWFITSM